MLADRAKINVRGGRGGNGCVSFRREKFVPKGGPDGGDGGHGGAVILVATRQVPDLRRFLQQHHFRAANGVHGQGSLRRGADGADLVVEVPVGTEIRDEAGELLADLAAEGRQAILANGGEGGRGNTCFVSSTHQAPRFAEHGLPGQEYWIDLSLKLLADVGLVGLPNAGKSSLLAALTRARPKVAAYPFTTLEPNLGVLVIGDQRVVLADIPGLVEGASSGTGLGDRFLAHVERTSALVYVVDGAEGAEAVARALATVHEELAAFQPELGERPAVVVVNKTDMLDAALVSEVVKAADAAAAAAGIQAAAAPVAASAELGTGVDDVVRVIGDVLGRRPAPAAPAGAAKAALRPGGDRVGAFRIEPGAEAFRVVGAGIERLVAKADLSNEEAVRYIQEVMERAGVSTALRRAGAVPGDTVVIGETEFEFS